MASVLVSPCAAYYTDVEYCYIHIRTTHFLCALAMQDSTCDVTALRTQSGYVVVCQTWSHTWKIEFIGGLYCSCMGL